jgi:hypothetical protein
MRTAGDLTVDFILPSMTVPILVLALFAGVGRDTAAKYLPPTASSFPQPHL